jgi:hypothetical protein
VRAVLFTAIFVLTASCRTLAEHLEHHHDEEAHLGHHWAIPSYTHELHLQLIIITAALATALLWAVIAGIRGRRKCAG